MFTMDFLDRVNHALPMTDFLERSPKSKQYCCPFCDSGKGPNRTGAFHYYPETNTGACFASCKNAGEEGHAYDLIAVVGKAEGLEFVDAVKYIANRASIPIEDDYNGRSYGATTKEPETVEEMIIDPPKPIPNTEGKYKDFIKAAAANVDPAREYLHERGISDEIIEKYEIGYTMKYFAGAGKELPAVVFPYNREYSYYSLRSIEGKYFYKPPTPEAGEEPLYRPENLYTGAPAWICEGALDALAIIEAGGNAVALIGTAYGKVLNAIKEQEPPAPLVLYLDNDKPNPKTGKREGPEKQAEFAKELKKRRIPYREALFNYSKYKGAIKDGNDLIRSNPEQFKKDIAANIAAVLDPTGIDGFLFEVQTDRYRPIPTGIASIDKLLHGGFIPQTLILCGAAPGMGKTCLGQQIFESLAEHGKECIYFNFEMAEAQLLARSISRRVYINNNRHALTALDVLQSYKLLEPDKLLVQEAAKEYKEKVGTRLLYNPAGVGTCLNEIIEHITAIGNKALSEGRPAPAIAVDYLHLLTGEAGEEKADLIRRAMNAFKKYAKDFNTFVFAIMAQNREANAKHYATTEAGRDSSNLEYGADLILQLFQEKDAKEDEVMLAVTKSRFSETNKKGIKYILHGGQSYLELEADKWKKPERRPAPVPYKD